MALDVQQVTMGKAMCCVISYDRMPLIANPGFVLNSKENNLILFLNVKVTIPISPPNSDNIFDGFFRHDNKPFGVTQSSSFCSLAVFRNLLRTDFVHRIAGVAPRRRFYTTGPSYASIRLWCGHCAPAIRHINFHAGLGDWGIGGHDAASCPPIPPQDCTESWESWDTIPISGEIGSCPAIPLRNWKVNCDTVSSRGGGVVPRRRFFTTGQLYASIRFW